MMMMTPTPTSERGLAALPSALARRLLLWAVEREAEKRSNRDDPSSAMALISNPSRRLPSQRAAVESLQQFARVSTAWRTLARDAASEIALSKFTLKLQMATRQTMLELRRQLTLRRAFVSHVVVARLPFAKKETGDGLKASAASAVQWWAVFSQLPVLEDLNLELMENVNPSTIAMIVRAASHHSHRLRSLVTHPPHSGYSMSLVPSAESRKDLIDAVYGAMDKSLKESGQVGFRRLALSMRNDINSPDETRAYLESVVRFAPNIEILDGYRTSMADIHEKICSEQWCADLSTWIYFCSSLCKLTEFNWIVAPFATRYFQVFGDHTKPRLRKMTFSTAVNWLWSRHLAKFDTATRDALVSEGHGPGAKKVELALRACPNLRTLHITWYFPRQLEGGPRFERYYLASNPTMDPEVFGDEFWKATVQFCPQLTTVSMTPAVFNEESNRPIESFTDRSLHALGSLPWLTFTELDTVNVTGSGLFDLISNHKAATTERRTFQVGVGDQRATAPDLRFYDVVSGFLKSLVDHVGQRPILSRDVILTITNNSHTRVSRPWSQEYFDKLRRLIVEAAAKHPHVHIHVLADSMSPSGFSVIEKFMFTTGPRKEPVWEDEDNITEFAEGLWVRASPQRSSSRRNRRAI